MWKHMFPSRSSSHLERTTLPCLCLGAREGANTHCTSCRCRACVSNHCLWNHCLANSKDTLEDTWNVLKDVERTAETCSRAEVPTLTRADHAASSWLAHTHAYVAVGLLAVTEQVCAGICPFNFPAMIPLWMFPVCTTAGNTMLLKPSEKDPTAAMMLADLALQVR